MKNFLLILSLVFCSCNSEDKKVAAKTDLPTNPMSYFVPVSVPAARALVTAKHSTFYNPKILSPIERMVSVLESDTYTYKWKDNSSCNVGIMTQIVSDLSQRELVQRLQSDYPDFDEYTKSHKDLDDPGSWRTLINYYCGVTGKPMGGVVSSLNKAGFTNNDIIHLEWLNDKYILSKTSIDASQNYYYGNKTNLITYLKAWENIIKEQNNNLVQ